MDDPRLERQFQAELAALEAFRVGYVGSNPHVPLRGDDPDVQRMIEALAFFTARTRLASERAVDDSLHRIFRQHFPYLLAPVPALTMLTVTPNRGLAEPADVPAGTAIDVVSERAPGRVFSFRTLSPLQLLPIRLESLTVRLDGDGAPAQRSAPQAAALLNRAARVRGPSERRRVELRFCASFHRSTQFDAIDLHIDYMHDIGSSLLVYSELRRHAERVSVAWDTVDTQLGEQFSREVPCALEFRAPADLSGEFGPLDHPVQRIRAALHFPQQELKLRITKLAPPSNWLAFTVYIELGSAWPEAVPLQREYFRTHTVPVVNAQRSLSAAIEHDGTRERHRLQHNARAPEHLVPVMVHGAYRMSKTGLVPLVPSVLAPKGDSYEAHTEGSGPNRRAYLSLAMEGAFETPATLVGDLTWHQPDIMRLEARDLRARFATRALDASLSLDHELAAPLEFAVEHDHDTLLELLAIKGHRVLTVDDVRLLLRALGVGESALLRGSLDALTTMRAVERPSLKRRRGLRYVYEVEFGHLTASDLPKAELLCEQVFDLLRVWSGTDVVEMSVSIPSLEREFKLTAKDSEGP